MKIIKYEFKPMADSAQFCTNSAIYAFHELGFIEFMAYCMINSQATPVDIEIEQVGTGEYMCHVRTVCDLIALSEKCIQVKGRLERKEVNRQMQINVRERIVNGL